jgi:hypothetical protein
MPEEMNPELNSMGIVEIELMNPEIVISIIIEGEGMQLTIKVLQMTLQEEVKPAATPKEEIPTQISVNV